MPFVGHEPLTPQQTCTSPEHEPPTMIVLPEGWHTWRCPACGHEAKFLVTRPRC